MNWGEHKQISRPSPRPADPDEGWAHGKFTTYVFERYLSIVKPQMQMNHFPKHTYFTLHKSVHKNRKKIPTREEGYLTSIEIWNAALSTTYVQHVQNPEGRSGFNLFYPSCDPPTADHVEMQKLEFMTKGRPVLYLKLYACNCTYFDQITPTGLCWQMTKRREWNDLWHNSATYSLFSYMYEWHLC